MACHKRMLEKKNIFIQRQIALKEHIHSGLSIRITP